MVDVRKLVPRKSEYLASEDLMGRGDVVLTITNVEMENATFEQGRKEQVAVVTFKEAQRRMVLNKTNSRRIADWHGWDTDGWIDKQVTLYVDQTRMAGKQVPCIRVRPKGGKKGPRTLGDIK